MYRLLLVYALVFGVCAKRFRPSSSKYEAQSKESDLMRYLKEKYEAIGTETRPVYNTSKTMHINVGLALIYVDKIESVAGGSADAEITVSAWLRYMWKDKRMTWNPEEYGGVDHIRIPIQYIWRPDIVLYNSFDLGLQQDLSGMAVVSSDGSVLWIPMAKLRVPAFSKAEGGWFSGWFSGDEENVDYDWSCGFKFGSWTYDGFRLDVDFYDGLEDVDLNDFVGGKAQIVAHSGRKNVKYYPCCAEPYPDLVFSLKIKTS